MRARRAAGRPSPSRSSRWLPAAKSTSASRSGGARRSTRCTRSCARSARASAAAEGSFRLSLSPALLERLRELTRRPAGGDRRRGRRGAASLLQDGVRSRDRGFRGPAHASASGPSPSRWSAGDWEAESCPPALRPPPRSGCSPAAGSRLAARCRPSAASIRTTCSRSSSGAAPRSRSRSSSAGQEAAARDRRSPDRDQGGRVPRRAHAGRRTRADRPRPRRPDPVRRRGRAARSPTRTSRPRARRSSPTRRPCSRRPRWC